MDPFTSERDIWHQTSHAEIIVSTFYIASAKFDALNVIINLLLAKKNKKNTHIGKSF